MKKIDKNKIYNLICHILLCPKKSYLVWFQYIPISEKRERENILILTVEGYFCYYFRLYFFTGTTFNPNDAGTYRRSQNKINGKRKRNR